METEYEFVGRKHCWLCPLLGRAFAVGHERPDNYDTTPVSIVWLQSLKEKTIVFIYIVLSFYLFWTVSDVDCLGADRALDWCLGSSPPFRAEHADSF